MRTTMAERFADALSMTMYLETAGVAGEVSAFIPLADDLRIPVKLKTVNHFDAGHGKDAAILLDGPGDLLLFLGYSFKSQRLHLALIDGAKMKRFPRDIMRYSNFVKTALKKFGEGGAVRARWTQKNRQTPWMPHE